MKSFFFHILPKSLVSRLFGLLASSKTPIWAPLFKNVFCKMYKLNEAEMQYKISEYPNLQALFTRRLKPGSRPLAQDLVVSPVDGKVSQCGELVNAELKMIQAKGRSYDLTGLLGDSHWASEYQGGQWATIYLAPFNYHRIHSPASGTVSRVKHLPGQLWPVNRWSVDNISELFCVNERLITELTTPQGGKILVVKVGATNVGRISLAFSDWVTNEPGQFGAREWIPNQTIELEKGAELGCFELGSTVILVLDAKARQEGIFVPHLSQAVQVGQSLL